METAAVIGFSIAFGAICLSLLLVLWSRRIIHRIERMGRPSLREIKRGGQS